MDWMRANKFKVNLGKTGVPGWPQGRSGNRDSSYMRWSYAPGENTGLQLPCIPGFISKSGISDFDDG